MNWDPVTRTQANAAVELPRRAPVAAIVYVIPPSVSNGAPRTAPTA